MRVLDICELFLLYVCMMCSSDMMVCVAKDSPARDMDGYCTMESVWTCMCVCVCVCVCMNACVSLWFWMYVNYECVCMYVCIYICIYVCMYVCIHTY